MSALRLDALAWAVVGPAVLLGLAPLLDGIGRAVRARLESRAGPPLVQGYLDLAKLAVKEERSAAAGPLASVLTVTALAAAVAAGLLLPLGRVAPLGFAGDALAVVYLLGLSSVSLALAGSVGGSPYGFLGLGRELVLLLHVEPVVACGLFVTALKAGTFRLDQMAAWQASHGLSVSGVLALAGVLLALVAWMGRVPFDLGEAEQELMGGSTMEYGGRRLAWLRWALFTRWLVVSWLVAVVWLPVPGPPALAAPASLAVAVALFAASSFASTLLARLRLDRARAYLVQVGLLMGFAVVFALIGA